MSIQDRQIWDILQIDAGADKREIKRAYARLSKEIHPDARPEEFQRLYEAYQKALKYVSDDKKPERTILNFETNQKEGDQPENKSAQPKKERNRFEELGLELEKNSENQYKYDVVEEITYFQHWWEKQMPIWLKKESFLDEESAAYLQSESFRKIMWSPVVLKIIAEGLGRYFLRNEKILLFFWDLYGFEEAEEDHYKEESLLLYRKLYPAYTNRKKRQQYAENKKEIQKEERKSIYKKIIVGVCLLLAFLGTFLINEDVPAIIFLILIVLLMAFFGWRWFISSWR